MKEKIYIKHNDEWKTYRVTLGHIHPSVRDDSKLLDRIIYALQTQVQESKYVPGKKNTLRRNFKTSKKREGVFREELRDPNRVFYAPRFYDRTKRALSTRSVNVKRDTKMDTKKIQVVFFVNSSSIHILTAYPAMGVTRKGSILIVE